MIPNQKLIDALRNAANRIEVAPHEYDWSSQTRCNCGILAQELLDMTSFELYWALDEPDYDSPNSWSSFAREQQLKLLSICSDTHLPLNKVFQALIANGIEIEDFEKIEYLKGSKLKSEDPTDFSFANPKDVVSSFRQWANELEVKLLQKTSIALPTKVKVPQTVRCLLDN